MAASVKSKCQRWHRTRSRDDTSLQHSSSIQDLVLCPVRRSQSWSAFDNLAFVGSQTSLDNAIHKKGCYSDSKGGSTSVINTMAVKNQLLSASANKRAYVSAIREPPDGDWGWLVVLCAALLTTVSAGILSSYGFFLPSAVEPKTLGPYSAPLWLWIAAWTFALHNLSYPVWTFLCYQTSNRKMAILGSLLFCGVLLLLYLNSNSIWIYVLFVLAGLGTSACCVSSIRSVEDFFSSRLNVSCSLSQSGWAFGLLIWPQVLNLSIKSGEAPWTILTVVIIGAVSLLASSLFGPAEPHYKTYYVIQATLPEDIVDHEKLFTVSQELYSYVFTVIVAVVNVARMMVIFKLPKYMLLAGLTEDELITAFCFCSIADIVGRLFGGWIQDYAFPVAFRFWSCAGLLIGGSVVVTSSCSLYKLLVASVTCMGLAGGLWTSLSSGSVDKLSIKTKRKDLKNMIFFLQALLSGVAPFVQDLPFSAKWMNSPLLCMFGIIIILSSIVASIVHTLLNCKHE